MVSYRTRPKHTRCRAYRRALWIVLIPICVYAVEAQTLDSDVATWPDGAFLPSPSRLSPGTAEGTAVLEPQQLSPAQIGTYQLHFTVGKAGIVVGGGLMVDFPKAWFADPIPLRKAVQTKRPEAPHHIEAKASRPGAALSITIDKLNFDGKNERFRFMLNLRVEGTPLQEGDTVTVAFSNTPSPYLSGPDEVRVAVDASGKGQYRLIPKGAAYEVACGEAALARLFAPSQAVVGQPIELQLTLFDRFYNPAESHEATFQITGLGPDPVIIELSRNDRGRRRFSWTPGKEGFHFPTATQTSGTPMIAAGGPVRVYATEPSIKVYWGDLHSHSRISKDAIGGDDFDYARNITCLDFFPSTEHCNDDARQDSITPGEWRFIQDQVQRFNEPGRFVTLLAYEASLGTGHHNIIYRSLEGSPWPAHRLKEIADVWERLKVGDAITIPHHMGIHWGSSKWGPVVDWTKPQDDRLRPLLEIYSLHGASEYYNPEDPLAYDNVDFTPASSADGPHYARDAWGQGHVMGVVGGSDNHTAQPGLPHGGLTAVFAPELTRHAIFDALAQRHSYGTTGERILLEFDVASAAMGQQATASGNVQGNLLVAAPRDIRFAEVLSLEGASTQWHSVARWESPGKLLRASFDTTVGKTGATLYLRIELTGETGGRVTRAWSSPIWLRP